MIKILVIEDKEAIRDNLFEILDDRGFDVYMASNGKDGLKLVTSIIPDLILCDILMPKISGYEVKKSLMLDKTTALIPFIFLTAKVEPKDIRDGMNLGADDYIIKPFNREDLLNSIDARLLKARNLKEINSGIPETKKNVAQQSAELSQKKYITLNNSPELVNLSTITYIESEGNYTHVYFNNNKKLLVRKLVKDWENLLPEDDFIRIHQSIIVSINHIEKIERFSSRNYRIKIRGYSDLLPISQRYSSLIKNKFKA